VDKVCIYEPEPLSEQRSSHVSDMLHSGIVVALNVYVLSLWFSVVNTVSAAEIVDILSI